MLCDSRHLSLSAATTLLCLLLGTALAQEDPAHPVEEGDRVVVNHVDGRTFQGLLVRKGPNSYTVKMTGGTIPIPRDRIESILPVDTVESDFEPTATPTPTPEPTAPPEAPADEAADATAPVEATEEIGKATTGLRIAMEQGEGVAEALGEAIVALEDWLAQQSAGGVPPEALEDLTQPPPAAVRDLIGVIDSALRGEFEQLRNHVAVASSLEQCHAHDTRFHDLLGVLEDAALRGAADYGLAREKRFEQVAHYLADSYSRQLALTLDADGDLPEARRGDVSVIYNYLLVRSDSPVRREGLAEDPWVQTTAAELEYALGREKAALERVEAVVAQGDAPRPLILRARELASKWEAAIGPEATPTPTPTPAATPDGLNWTEAEVADYPGLAAEWVGRNQETVGLIVVILAVGWLLPNVLLTMHARKNPRARQSRGKVLVLGLLGYASYLVGAFFTNRAYERARLAALESSQADTDATPRPVADETQSKKKRKRDKAATHSEALCSTCGKPLDDLDAYAVSMRFDQCPHCSADIEPIFTFEDYLQGLMDDLTLQATGQKKTRRKKRKAQDEGIDEAAMARFIDAMFTMAVRRRATDIHIERTAQGASVKLRVDGMLSDALSVPVATAPAFLSALKVAAGLDITNHSTPQDGRWNREADGIEFDVRINCAPTSAEGEILFMRLLDRRNIEALPRDLGFQGSAEKAFEEAIRKPHGLILVTGPTGSGKSTTLYVAMNQINTGERNIVTLEDPVEYRINGLKQMQVNPNRGFTFATGLRSIMRQDPDVIMVGEVRDAETANMAVEAASTGHLVFTTLHTMDTATAVSRLNDLGVPSKRYASALELIVAQRLVRLICENCKQDHLPPDQDLERLGILKLRSSIKFKAGPGCQQCNYVGYFGRQAIIEMLKPNEEMREFLTRETRPSAIRQAARKQGMRLLREEGILKIVAGKTTVEEVIRATT